MFEITRNDYEALEYYMNEGMAYKKAVYDFTFENRFLIYHAPQSHQVRYFALDMQTKLTSEICRRKDGEYLEHEYKELIPKILSGIKYTGDRRYLNIIGNEPEEMIDTIFRVILPEYGYAVREEQINLCKKMYLGLTGKQVAICEAEVGTGKSMAYLVAALCASKLNQQQYNNFAPVTITTSNIELQNALIEKEIPMLSRILMEYHFIDRPLVGVLRKGKEHYFCRFRYFDFVNGIKQAPTKYETMLEFFAEKKFDKTAFDLDRIKMPGSVKGRICVKGNCGNCENAKDCRYKSFVDKAMDSRYHIDFQVTNHNLYLMSTQHKGLLRNSNLVIVDEAHKFKEAAQQAFGESISESTIKKYLNWTKTKCKCKKNARLFNDLQTRIAVENQRLFNILRKRVKADDMDDNSIGTIITLDGDVRMLIQNIAEDIEALETLKDSTKGRREVNGKRICDSLLSFSKPSKISTWVEVDENNETYLCCCPKKIGVQLADLVWNKNRSHVLTSGTMSDGTDFSFFKRENGLDRISNHMLLETSTPSPFDYAHNTRLYIPNDIPFPDNDNEEYIKCLSERIVQLVNATNGHTAILFTTYKVLQAVYEQTKERLGNYDVICMTRSNKTAIADFKKSKNGVLFASGSMWEGVDCIGDTLSSVIIVRLPFPRRCATMEQKKNECNDVSEFVKEYAVPEMLIKLRQGAGRLIRCESDTGVLSILDSRASESGAYRNRVLTALDKYPLVNTIEEISDFMQTIKSAEYFE